MYSAETVTGAVHWDTPGLTWRSQCTKARARQSTMAEHFHNTRNLTL